MEKYLYSHNLDNLQKLSHVLGKDLVFVDLETTGLLHSPIFSVIELGIVSISPNKIQEMSTLIDPGVRIPADITALTGINNHMVKGKPDFNKYSHYFKKVAHESILLGFNSKSFDSKALEKQAKKYHLHYNFHNQIDIRYLFIRERNQSLNMTGMSGSLTDASQLYNVKLNGTAHRAGYDIGLTVLVAEAILKKRGLSILKDDISKLTCKYTKDKFRQQIL